MYCIKFLSEQYFQIHHSNVSFRYNLIIVETKTKKKKINLILKLKFNYYYLIIWIT